MLCWRKPTPDRVSPWFWGTNVQFNHETAGMTNPCLHVTSSSSPLDVMRTTIPVSTKASAEGDVADATTSGSWWPGTACSDVDTKHWRRGRLCRRMGQSAECYQRLRDAALQWEFVTKDKGMIQVQQPESSKTAQPVFVQRGRYSVMPLSEQEQPKTENLLDPIRSNRVMQIWSGPGRKLVTYTTAKGNSENKVMRFLSKLVPPIYAVNPVSVVYDLVDQRGPQTTYTSTAYSTLKGHWLCGEERVSVLLRDDQSVDVELLSYSRPTRSVVSKLLWPLVDGMQQRFFQQQLNVLEEMAKATTPSSMPSSTTNLQLQHPARGRRRHFGPLVIETSAPSKTAKQYGEPLVSLHCQ